MRMRNLVVSSIALTLAAVPLLAVEVTTSRDRGPVTSCDQIETSWRGKVMESEEQRLSVSGSGGLTVDGVKNGGIYVTRGRGSNYEVTVCKAAAGESSGDALSLLRGVTASAAGGRLSVTGPSGGNWLAHVIIQAPANANLDLSTTNGGISLHDVDGRIKADATNGPISVKSVSGKIDASTKNGPISLTNGSGEMVLNAQNGPITVNLEGSEWTGGSLEAHTKNGPLTLRLPNGFRSGVIVDASEHSPVTCDCPDARASFEGKQKRFEFGSSTPVVRMSTVNGPVSIKAGGTAF